MLQLKNDRVFLDNLARQLWLIREKNCVWSLSNKGSKHTTISCALQAYFEVNFAIDALYQINIRFLDLLS